MNPSERILFDLFIMSFGGAYVSGMQEFGYQVTCANNVFILLKECFPENEVF